MTPGEFKERAEELHALIVEKLAELEEDPNWGAEEEREELTQSLGELLVQVEALRDALQGE